MLFSNYQSDINGWLSCKTKKEKKNEKTVCPKTFSTLPFHKNIINWYKSVFSVFSVSWYLIYPRILICTLYWEKEYTFTLVLLFTVVVGITVIDVWTKRPSKFEKCTKGYFVVLPSLTLFCKRKRAKSSEHLISGSITWDVSPYVRVISVVQEGRRQNIK